MDIIVHFDIDWRGWFWEDFGMATWAPLWSFIIDSTLWTTGTKEARLMFVTMLAKKDADGFVGGTVPSMARDANLTMKEAESAIKELESPDKWSNNQKDKGRRIKRVDNGWVVLNHFYYRDKIKEEYARYRKAYKARKQREYRAKTNGVPLGGEQTFVKREGDGAPPEELDRLVANR